MSAKNQLYRQYRTIIELWPIDPLRPLSFQTFLRDRVAKQFGLSVEGDAAQGSSAPSAAGDQGVGKEEPVVKFSETKAASELNALQTLLEDRYRKKYPITEKLLRPRGNPEYYEKLLRELEAAPERSWWQAKLNSWKGYIRMQ